jgi:hypothetical protein
VADWTAAFGAVMGHGRGTGGFELMIHRTVVCAESRSSAICCCATFRPDSEAITAINAVQVAIKIRRRRCASATTVPLEEALRQP